MQHSQSKVLCTTGLPKTPVPVWAPLTPCLGIKSLGGYGIDLIYEDDGRCILLGQTEHIPDHAGALTQVLLYKLRAHHPDKRS